MTIGINLSSPGVDLVFKGTARELALELAALRSRMPLVPPHRFPSPPRLRLATLNGRAVGRANTGGCHEVAPAPDQNPVLEYLSARDGAPVTGRQPRVIRGTMQNSAAVADGVAPAHQERLSSEPAVAALAEDHAAAAVSGEDNAP
ncbi:hypothetical protein [Aestuariivirga sp.]|uniref:hypothetical protein n=1 Tax=Aestuariivirga sp. TaxID=2650926 RepID=UPI0039E6223A